MLTSINPKLPMRDKIATKNYYINQLDFEEIADYGDYLLIQKDHIEIHFFEFKELNITQNYGQVYIRTDNIDKFYETLLQKNVNIHPNGTLQVKPWGQKEFSLLDPDNNLLTFGQNLENEIPIRKESAFQTFHSIEGKSINQNLGIDTKFDAGINIAVKIPKSKYEKTVSFYREILKFEVKEMPIINPTVSRSHQVKFGNNVLWLDCVDNYTHSETWLELNVTNVEQATTYLKINGIEPCDEIEQLPENMHWITDPAGTVFLLKSRD